MLGLPDTIFNLCSFRMTENKKMNVHLFCLQESFITIKRFFFSVNNEY